MWKRNSAKLNETAKKLGKQGFFRGENLDFAVVSHYNDIARSIFLKSIDGDSRSV